MTTIPSIVHKMKITCKSGNVVSLYIIVRLDGGKPSGVECKGFKKGSTLQGFTESVCEALTVALERGAPMTAIVERFRGMEFDPRGETNNQKIPTCTSIVDYLVRFMESVK